MYMQIQEPTRGLTTSRVFDFLAKFQYHKIFETNPWKPKHLHGWT